MQEIRRVSLQVSRVPSQVAEGRLRCKCVCSPGRREPEGDDEYHPSQENQELRRSPADTKSRKEEKEDASTLL